MIFLIFFLLLTCFPWNIISPNSLQWSTWFVLPHSFDPGRATGVIHYTQALLIFFFFLCTISMIFSAILILSHYLNLSYLVSELLLTYLSVLVVHCLPFLSAEPELDVDELFVTVLPLFWEMDFSGFAVFFSLTHHTHSDNYFAILLLYCLRGFKVLLSFFCFQLCWQE